MQLRSENIKENPVTLLRRAGYAFHQKEGDEMSFVRVLARSGYPRFHVYVHLESTALVFNLHLDQKKETYGTGARHHGEYEDSKVVEDEAARIRQIIR